MSEEYVPYISLDPLNDPKSFTFRLKVIVLFQYKFYFPSCFQTVNVIKISENFYNYFFLSTKYFK